MLIMFTDNHRFYGPPDDREVVNDLTHTHHPFFERKNEPIRNHLFGPHSVLILCG